MKEGEGPAAGEDSGPAIADTAPTREDGDEPSGDEEGEERELSASHLAQGEFVDSGDAGEGNDRCAERAECNGRGIGDEGQSSGLEGSEAESDHECGGDGDGGTEAGGPFDEGAEGEGDHEGLHASIG